MDAASGSPTTAHPIRQHFSGANGGPGNRLEPSFLAETAARAGLRLIGIDRPGYGRSTPRPGRTIADGVPDALAVNVLRRTLWGEEPVAEAVEKEISWQTWVDRPNSAPWVQVVGRFHSFDSILLTVDLVPDYKLLHDSGYNVLAYDSSQGSWNVVSNHSADDTTGVSFFHWPIKLVQTQYIMIAKTDENYLHLKPAPGGARYDPNTDRWRPPVQPMEIVT